MNVNEKHVTQICILVVLVNFVHAVDANKEI